MWKRGREVPRESKRKEKEMTIPENKFYEGILYRIECPECGKVYFCLGCLDNMAESDRECMCHNCIVPQVYDDIISKNRKGREIQNVTVEEFIRYMEEIFPTCQPRGEIRKAVIRFFLERE